MVKSRLQTQKVSLFIVASSTILIEHEIFNPKKGTTKVAMSKLWPVYACKYISSLLDKFFSLD